VLAAALKRTTSVSIGWLAQRLERGALTASARLFRCFGIRRGME
jgi:hypothetical protein